MHPDAMTDKLLASLEADGFTMIEHVLDDAEVTNVVSAIEADLGAQSHRSAGARNLHQRVPAVAELLRHPEISRLIQRVLPGAFPVRSILFDKTPETNWKVAWHQDLTICVQARVDMEGFGPWSIKEGIVHVQPPASVLNRMVTLRIHLDDCTAENGPLLVLAKSHRDGRLSADAIARWKTIRDPVSCVVSSGGAVLMKPLLLHASSTAQNPKHRRVVHVEYAADALPSGLQWLQ